MGTAYDAVHGESENRLRYIYAMSARQGNIRFGANGPRTFQHLLRQFGREFIYRPAEYCDGKYRRAAHGIYIADGVGACNSSEGECIINDRCKKIRGADQRGSISEIIYSRVIFASVANQQLRKSCLGRIAFEYG